MIIHGETNSTDATYIFFDTANKVSGYVCFWRVRIYRGLNGMTVINELDTTCGITDEELTERFKESIRIDDEIRRIKGAPFPRYDKETKQAYLEYPDGRREYVGCN